MTSKISSTEVFDTQSIEEGNLPNLEYFEGLMLDDLRRKYSGNRLLKYQEYTTEKVAIQWYKQKLTNYPLAAV